MNPLEEAPTPADPRYLDTVRCLISLVMRISAPFERAALANEALYRAYNNKN